MFRNASVARVCLAAAVCLFFFHFAHAADWQQPTPQELSMTSEPAQPDAAAVYLFREEIADDQLHMHSVYVRLKVLSEEGKKYADVEIPYEKRNYEITGVSGRTIHSDGTVVPFTGKPYDKLIVKTSTYHYQAKVFSMPDVQVGSILEYKYVLRYEDHSLLPPTWYIQSDLYLRKAHYRFVPYDGDIVTGHGKHEQNVSTLRWYPILPKGVEIKHWTPPSQGVLNQLHDRYDLDVDNIPAEPKDEYLPPIHSLTYRVYFQYSPYQSREEFWSKEGKYWAHETDKFVGPGSAAGAVVSRVTLPGDSQEQKLQKLYAEVMTYENTDFTRQRTSAENKAEGLHEVKTSDDILTRKRGSSDELAMAFVALARAAGMKAYVMRATSREYEIFNMNVLSLDQLDSTLAIVNINGKDKFFDPGQRYCTYGQLRWDHTGVEGMRQTDGGTEIARTPDAVYTDAKTVRVAKLALDESGQIDGTIQIGYNGDPALAWRQRALVQDQAEVEKEMEDATKNMLPGGLTVKVEKVLYLDDPTKQLVAMFAVHGPLANSTSKRMFVPLSLFEVNEKPKFTQAKREMPVYFHYGYQVQDQVTITYPASMEVESTPQVEEVKMQSLAVLREGAVNKNNTVTLARFFAVGSMIFKIDEYDDLRTFYGKVAHKDQEQAIFKMASKVATHATGN